MVPTSPQIWGVPIQMTKIDIFNQVPTSPQIWGVPIRNLQNPCGQWLGLIILQKKIEIKFKKF